MKKTLYELACEYEESIAAMTECVKKLRLEKRQARLDGDTDKLKLVSVKLYTVYEEIRDMRIVAETLKNYYGTTGKKEECA